MENELEEQVKALSNEELLEQTRQYREQRRANPMDKQTATTYRLLVVECARRGIRP